MENENTPKHKVLIIDDDRTLLEMFQKKFETEGFIVAVEDNGLGGLSKASEMKPDVVLLDIMMPGMDGFETLSAFRNNTSLDSIIIIFTNLGQQPTYIQMAIALKADDYILKSNHTPAEIVERVKELIVEKAKRKQEDEDL